MKSEHLDKLHDICERLDWSWYESDDFIELRRQSIAGEDFSITISKETPVCDIAQEYEDFNIEDHVHMWLDAKKNGVSGIPDIETLLIDAGLIEEMLFELSNACSKEMYR